MTAQPPTIAFVIPHGVQLFYPSILHKQGGAEVQLALLVRELAKRKEVRPIVLLGAYGQPERDEVDGIALRSFAHKPGLAGRFSLWRALAACKSTAIVQRASGSMTANVAAYSLLTRTPFIYWAASDFDCMPAANPALDYPPRNRFFDWGLRRATAIIAQHAGQVGLLQRHLGRTPAAVIPNGWPGDAEAPPMPLAQRRHHLWVGHATAHKNPLALLDLAEAAPHEDFIMVLPPERAQPDVLRQVEARASQLRNVQILPRVPFAEMHQLYANAKTHIITSLAEGFPNTLLQALWNGVLVLSLYVDPGKMLLTNGIGICTNGDPTALIEKFKQLAADPGQTQAMSLRARAFAARELSIGRVAELFTALLREQRLLR